VKDRDVARKMVYFVWTGAPSACASTRSCAPPGSSASSPTSSLGRPPRLFDFARRRLAERWQALRAAVAASGTFRLQEVASGYCTFTNQTVTACPGT
jgi:L-tryptophan---pyruvate aminotransferase